MARARGRTPLLTEPTRNGQHFDLDSADGRRCARAHAQSSPVCLKGHKPHSKKVPGKKNRQICECYCPRDQLPQELDAETERHRSGGVWCPELDSTRTFSSAIETKVKTDMEEEIGRTLVQVISEKYNEDNFPYRRGAGVVIHTSPQGSSVTDRLNLPSVLVLENCGIIHAGDEEEVAAFCAHVVELDLSFNKFRDWGEIIKILSNIPHLDFLNLSMNPLSSSLEPVGAEAFSSLRCLVLNNTHISWNMVHMLTREIPELEELFLCLNEYKCVSMSPIPCPSLRLLHITDNQLHDWGEVRKLGLLYPHLTSLILANNSLSSINEPEDSLQCLFSNLHSINLHNSRLNGWEDIEKLNFFPKLCEVHLMGIPLLQPYTDQERRYLAIAHLPSVTVLNGSVVTDGEREDAERFYIRYHLDSPEDELPQRFHNLVAHYGCLAPLADVDLRPLSCAQVELHFGDNTKKLEIRLKQTVADLKKQLRPVVQLPVNKTRVYYIDRQMGYALAPQELKYGARALHSYNIQDGDEILVVPKSH